MYWGLIEKIFVLYSKSLNDNRSLSCFDFQQIDDINKKKQEIINKLEDIKHLNYKNVLEKEPVENIYDKLILIRKFMDIDLHRAKMEMDKLLKLF